MRIFFFTVSFLLTSILFAQTDLEKVQSYHRGAEPGIYRIFIDFLKIPNVATDTMNIRKNADFLVRLMKGEYISNVRLLQADEENVPPVVYGEVKAPNASKTIIFYAHYDGQPVNATTWAKGLHPFLPQLLNGRFDEGATIQSPNFPLKDNWRIYARGASDDKDGVMAILNAFIAINNSGIQLPYNIKFFFEGEEEQGHDLRLSFLQTERRAN